MRCSKKRALIVAVLTSVLLLSAILSALLVIAAQKQNIPSSFGITYSVDGVGAKVSAKYGLIKPTGEVSMVSMTTADGVSTDLNFSILDTIDGVALKPNGDITLTQATGTEVVFEFRFENTADTLFTVGMTSAGTVVNVAEYYYVSAEPLATSEYGRIIESSLSRAATRQLAIPKQAILETTGSGDVLYIYVKVALADINEDVNYKKSFNWNLKQLTKQQEPYEISLNNGDGTGETSVTVIKGAAVPLMTSLPTAPAGKGFAGYYDAQTEGNLIVNKNGMGVKELTTETTLYARYDEESVLDIVGTVLYGFSPTVNISELNELIIPDSVTEIKTGALQNLTELTYLALPSTITSLPGINTEDAPLMGCENLETIEFNISVLPLIGEYEDSAFARLFGYFDYNDYCFVGTINNVKEVILNGGSSIGDYAFYGSNTLLSISIPNSVTTIGNYPFTGCTSLTEISIPNSVTTIGDYAFLYCEGLETAIIGNSVTTIGINPFDKCYNLTSVTIPDSVTTIPIYAFQDCISLTTITIPDSVTAIGEGAFKRCGELETIVIPDSVATMGKNVFDACTKLTSITISNSLSTIPSSTFINCTSLGEITIPNSVTSIEYNAFMECTSLTSVTIPDSVTTIGEGAFKYCERLATVTIPNTVTTIEKSAFNG
ncbi:MAG: leucine-rich repeat domain-containing protein, partial [Clostridia bacterium]